MESVQQRFAELRQGDQATRGGLRKIRNVQLHLGDDAGIDPGHSGDFGDAVDQGQRSPLRMGKDVGKILTGIVGIHRLLQGDCGADGHDEGPDPAGEHQRDG